MLSLIKRYKIVIIGLIIPYALMMFLMTYRIDYRITMPGGLEAIDQFIIFEETFEQENSFYSVYVMSIEKPTFFQFIATYFDPYAQIEALPESRQNISTIVNWRSGQVSRNSAIDASIIASYQALGLTIEYEIQEIVYLIYNYIDNDVINIGDILLSVNDNENVTTAINQAPCGEVAVFKLLREGEIFTTEITKQASEGCLFGIALTTYYNITEIEIPYEVRSNLVGGGSGGLMQTLYVFNALSPYDLTQGYTIAGTGTMRINGTVGSIGGVRQKVYTAHMDGVDIFFVPSGFNALHAQEAYDKLDNPTMTLVEVGTFLEALNYLLNLHGAVSDEN